LFNIVSECLFKTSGPLNIYQNGIGQATPSWRWSGA